MTLTTLIAINIFILGLLVGSFLNVCYYRIPNELSILFPGSRCGSCQESLKARDLIPILSWIMAKGKCRYCGEKVSIRYPIVEGLTGLLSVVIFLITGLEWPLVMGLFLLYTGIIIVTIDLEHLIIPDGVNLTVFVGGVLYWLIQSGLTHHIDLTRPVLGLLVGFVPLFVIALFGAMGGGDYKYMAAAGWILGPALTGIALYIAFLFGGAMGAILLLTKKKQLKAEIPFGPYLVIGVLGAWLFGQQLIEWYVSTFL